MAVKILFVGIADEISRACLVSVAKAVIPNLVRKDSSPRRGDCYHHCPQTVI